MAKVTRIEPTVTELKSRKKVAAYARVSIESDRLNHSLSAQVSYYSNLIQKNPEWIYVGVYADSGISGGGISRRAEFKRLLADCEAGEIDIVLTKSISRFARNTVDLLETVRHLKSLGIDVWFEKENIQSLSADGELMLGILAGFAEEESRSQSDNAKWSIQKKFARGEQWHVAAYGYHWDGKSFVICEEEAKAIRVIYDNFLKDIPLSQTSRWLKKHGYACSIPFIRYVLQNMVYAGDVLLQRYITENPRTHRIIENKGQLPRYYVTDNHPAIIDRETFEKVQAKIKASYEFNSAAHRIVKPSCFSAKIICGKCGAHYVKGMTRTNAHDGLQEHWYCCTKIRKPSDLRQFPQGHPTQPDFPLVEETRLRLLYTVHPLRLTEHGLRRRCSLTALHYRKSPDAQDYRKQGTAAALLRHRQPSDVQSQEHPWLSAS